ncbi:MAG TPA: YbaK/EbsC family protein [Anaerolineales bacterium]|nr:YbaK/EbsC family protein [Anaerolineales bacterium]
MIELPPAAQALDRLGIPYRLFVHAHPPASFEEAASQRGQTPGQIVRSIVFRLAEGQFIMVLMAGPGQISWKRLRAALGVGRISMASEAEVLATTGFVRGAVTPLGLPHPMRILADTSVFAQSELSIGSGVRGVAVILKPTDLQSAVGAIETGNFAL